MFCQLSDNSGCLGHLHQREKTFLHTSTAGSGKTDKCCLIINSGLNSTSKALSDNRAHGTGHKTEFKDGNDSGHSMDGA